MEEFNRLNPEIAKKLGRFASCLVSEPIGNYQDIWKPIPESSQIFIGEARVAISAFDPKSAAPEPASSPAVLVTT